MCRRSAEGIPERDCLAFHKSGPNGESLVGKLNSSLYGIKQAAYEFYKILCKELEGPGFTKCEADHSLLPLQGRTPVLAGLAC